jgi:hypothetical protein
MQLLRYFKQRGMFPKSDCGQKIPGFENIGLTYAGDSNPHRPEHHRGVPSSKQRCPARACPGRCPQVSVHHQRCPRADLSSSIHYEPAVCKLDFAGERDQFERELLIHRFDRYHSDPLGSVLIWISGNDIRNIENAAENKNYNHKNQDGSPNK